MDKDASIVEFSAGDIVRIVKLDVKNDQHLRKLTAFGLLPGAEVAIIQKYPALVLAIGHSRLALDYEIADNILVRAQNSRQGKQ